MKLTLSLAITVSAILLTNIAFADETSENLPQQIPSTLSCGEETPEKAPEQTTNVLSCCGEETPEKSSDQNATLLSSRDDDAEKLPEQIMGCKHKKKKRHC